MPSFEELESKLAIIAARPKDHTPNALVLEAEGSLGEWIELHGMVARFVRSQDPVLLEPFWMLCAKHGIDLNAEDKHNIIAAFLRN